MKFGVIIRSAMPNNSKRKSAERFNKSKDGFNAWIIKLIPSFVKPNHLTILRIILLIPFVYLLLNDYYILALLVFIFAIITDSLDGSLARLRNQKSTLGMILDPIADRLLYITTIVIMGFRFIPDPTVIYVSIALEFSLIAVLFRPLLEKASGKKIGLEANIFGKIKMILQSTAILILFFIQTPTAGYISMIILWLAVAMMVLNIIKTIIAPKKAGH